MSRLSEADMPGQGVVQVPEPPFVDFYEVLQLSPNATTDTVERVYRMLAKRFHPDNQDTGDAARFAEVQNAYETLSTPSARAAYDVKYEENRATTWKVFSQQGASDHRSEDRRLFHAILSLLYIARRRDPHNGGLGSVTLEKLLGCPSQHLEFPIWYLKERGWVERLESGLFAITADGVDKIASEDLSLPANRLLAGRSQSESPAPVHEPEHIAMKASA
jgi:curved DNA-binding protein CbpA